jgi:hypothetical protein
MATTGRTSDYDDELLGPPADDDLIDVSVLVSTGPDVWVSTKMRYAEIKGASSAISSDIMPIGDGSGIIDGQWKSGDLSGDGVYLSNENHHTTSNYYGYHDKSTGNSWLNGATGINFTIGGSPIHAKISSGLIELLNGPSSQTMQIGNSISSPTDSKIYVKASGTTNVLDLVDSSETSKFLFTTAGFFGMEIGTSINEISIDGTLAGDSDDAVPTEKAVKTYVDAQSGGGWLGSETRIKIAPWDIVSYNDKDGVSIQDDGGVVNDAAAKITTMVTGVFIPTGYKATAFMINASANIAIELFESQIDDSTAVSRGSGNANTEVNITNVDSTITNYLSIIIVEAGNDIQGGYVVIQEI